MTYFITTNIKIIENLKSYMSEHLLNKPCIHNDLKSIQKLLIQNKIYQYKSIDFR